MAPMRDQDAVIIDRATLEREVARIVGAADEAGLTARVLGSIGGVRPLCSRSTRPGMVLPVPHTTMRSIGADPVAALAADAAKANKQIDLLWIACGKDDAAMKGAKTLHEALQKAGIEHTFLETDGAHHWRVWRRYLRDLAPMLFK